MAQRKYTDEERLAWIAFAQAAIVAGQLVYVFDNMNDQERSDTIEFNDLVSPTIASDIADEMLEEYRKRFGVDAGTDEEG